MVPLYRENTGETVVFLGDIPKLGCSPGYFCVKGEIIVMKLLPHQEEGIDWLSRHRRSILADDLGLGKTAQAILAANRLFPNGRIIVIAPSTLLVNWEREIRLWLGEDYPVLVLDSYAGTVKEREQKLLDFTQGAVVVNYAAVRRMDKAVYSGADVVILDEAHHVKNRKSQTFKSIKVLSRNCDTLFLLTGTPVMNEVGDLWSLLHLIDRKRFSSYWRFVQAYSNVSRTYFGWVVEGVRNTRALRELLIPYLLRREKETTLNLPSKLIQTTWLEMTPEQKKIYDSMKTEMRAELLSGQEVHASVVIAQLTRLRQIAVSSTLLETNLLPLTGSKIQRLQDLCLTELPLVVFSQFSRALRGMDLTLTEKGLRVGTITGETKDRQALLDQFTRGELDVLGLTTSLGEGLTLTASSTAVFLDRMWTPARNLQAEDRLHRLGQTRPVTIVKLLIANTIEEYVERLLARKVKISRAVLSRDFLEEVLQ